MARPKETLAQQISRGTRLDLAEVEDLLERRPETFEGPCWTWHGALGGATRMTPVFRHQGKLLTVRGVLVGPYALVTCGNPLCVNPTHAMSHIERLMADEPEPERTEPEPEPNSTADVDNEGDLQDIRDMLADGVSLETLLQAYTQDEIDAALEIKPA